ncbi:MAG: type II toxin-antitoxin system PemK/MazF family toxin [Steroidobacteraceae bacterium]
MTIFSRGDVIKVPFPYTDRSTRRSRPALVVSDEPFHARHGLLWVVMKWVATIRSRDS